MPVNWYQPISNMKDSELLEAQKELAADEKAGVGSPLLAAVVAGHIAKRNLKEADA